MGLLQTTVIGGRAASASQATVAKPSGMKAPVECKPFCAAYTDSVWNNPRMTTQVHRQFSCRVTAAVKGLYDNRRRSP